MLPSLATESRFRLAKNCVELQASLERIIQTIFKEIRDWGVHEPALALFRQSYSELGYEDGFSELFYSEHDFYGLPSNFLFVHARAHTRKPITDGKRREKRPPISPSGTNKKALKIGPRIAACGQSNDRRWRDEDTAD